MESAWGGGFLGSFLVELEGVKNELRRKLTELQQADKEALGVSADGWQAQRELFMQLAKIPVQDSDEAVAVVRQHREHVGALYQRTTVLATEGYDMVDRSLKRLNQDLAHLEAEVQLQEAEDQAWAPDPRRKRRKGSLADGDSDHGRGKRQRGDGDSAGEDVSMTPPEHEAGSAGLPTKSPAEGASQPTAQASEPGDSVADPNEPVYCFCRRVSFGEMVGCDNDECEFEWFHFACVGLDTQPTGDWFCPQCAAKQRRS